jgi:hypothetical protein
MAHIPQRELDTLMPYTGVLCTLLELVREAETIAHDPQASCMDTDRIGGDLCEFAAQHPRLINDLYPVFKAWENRQRDTPILPEPDVTAAFLRWRDGLPPPR